MQKWEYCTVRRSFGAQRSSDTSSKMFLIVNGTVELERELPPHDTQEPRSLAPEKIIWEFMNTLGGEGWELVSDAADSMVSNARGISEPEVTITVKVISKSSGKPIQGKSVSLGFDGIFRGVTDSEYTDRNGEAHFIAQPGEGQVFINGSTEYEGTLSGGIVVYV